MALLYLSIVKLIIDLLPGRLKYAAARRLFNPANTRRTGHWLVIDYLKNQYGLKYLVNTHDYICWSIFFLGEYEADTNQVLAEWIKPGMTVIEAGANHGSETVILGKLVGETGHVFAFEPVPRLMNHLKLNLAINNLDKTVCPVQLAIGEKDETVIFHLPAADAANQGMPSKYEFSTAGARLEVPQKSLDNWLTENDIRRVDFIKMDIQGAEIDLLRGAKNCLQTMRPVLYLEADDVQSGNSSRTIQQLFDELEAADYAVQLVEISGRYPLTGANLKAGNWLATPQKPVKPGAV